jgi:preprotein translocase subunit SecG
LCAPPCEPARKTGKDRKAVLNVLTYLLVFVEVVCSLLLVGVILLQKTKGQGVGMAFGAGMGESLFGSQVGNVLTRTTVILAIVFLVNTTLLAVVGGSRRRESVAERISNEQGALPAPGPMTPPAGEVPAVPMDVPMDVPATPIEVNVPAPADETAAPPADETAVPAAAAAETAPPVSSTTPAPPAEDAGALPGGGEEAPGPDAAEPVPPVPAP